MNIKNGFRSLLIFLLTYSQAFAGSPVIWNGTRGKELTQKGFLLSDNSVVDNDGLLNYIKNGHGEISSTGWAAYADAAGTTPVDCTGGSPSETLTQTTSTPLIGAGSLLLTKGATNRQGDGASYACTIDSAYKSLPITISMLTNSTGSYASNDVKIYVYDVTNATIITPNAVNITSGLYQYQSYFTASTSTSYRLCVHTATTNASAYTLYMDSVYIGPGAVTGQGVATGSTLGLVSSFAPRPTSAVNPVSADYVITTSDGFSTILMTTASTARTVTLPAASANTGRQITIMKADSGSGGLTIARAGSDTIRGATTYLMAASTAGANAINCFVTLVSDGVSNWYVVAERARVYLLAYGTAVSVTSGTVINFSSLQEDTQGGYSAGRWTVPAGFGGVYQASIGGQNANPSVRYAVYLNGSVYRNIAMSDTAVGDGGGSISLAAAAGDIIDFRPTNATSGTIQASGWISISRIQ